jgi:putative membrane protein
MSFPRLCLAFTVLALIVSGAQPVDRKIWLMETAPVLVGGTWIALRWRAFPWTPLTLGLMSFFALILCAGGHWTYAQVPLGKWVQDLLHLKRNDYDRFGHFFQGVIPALAARELLRRCTGLRSGKALFWCSVCVALAISAFYELTEWWTTLLAAPDQGAAFVGSQGDEWDAQQDMFMALCGAFLSLSLLSGVQDRQIERLPRAAAKA